MIRSTRFNFFHAKGLYISFWPIPGFAYFIFDELHVAIRQFFQDFMDSSFFMILQVIYTEIT